MDQALERSRSRIGRFFGAADERVVFTLNATDALNMAIKGSVNAGDHVVTSSMEHNSVVRPLEALRDDGVIELDIAPADAQGRVTPDDITRRFRSNTRLVVLQHASNVCGARQPVREIGQTCRERGVRLLVDAAQTAGHVPIDVEEDGIDLLALAGHKGLLGPPGTGALILARDVDVRPWREGGTGARSNETRQPSEMPLRLEAGSPNGPAIAALAAGIDWLTERGVEATGARLQEIAKRLDEGLRDIDTLECYGPESIDDREAVFSVTLRDLPPHELSAVLDASFGVETRAGLHCAPGAHRSLGTWPDGSVRLAPGVFTTDDEIDATLAALREIAS
jgi:cysteine desulfurase family protein